MGNKEGIEKLVDTLAEAVSDARHYIAIDEMDKAKDMIDLAEKAMDAVRLINIDNSWQCRDPHCSWKHNDRGTHE